eukprot:5009958-Pyramimonas_sp.AAC.1
MLGAVSPRGRQSRNTASKMAQDTSVWVKIAADIYPRGSESAPIWIQVTLELSSALSTRSKSLASPGDIEMFGILPFSLPMGL